MEMQSNNSMSVIHPNAKIGKNVKISPFSYIEDNVEIGEGTEIAPYTSILYGSRIGKNCKIHPGAVIGNIPQDLKFKGEETLAIVGDNCSIREYVTINRGTQSKGKTQVGNNCLIMAYCHVAHDCSIGNNVIISNSTQVAGEVVVDDFAVIGGGCLIHQFVHIGSYVMMQGGTRTSKDIPPYAIVGREPAVFAGLNNVGLRRHGFQNETIEEILHIYRLIYREGMNTSQAVEEVLKSIPPSMHRDEILRFIKGSSRGILPPARKF
ncbi:MAG TPA: acyl-[acyl-carrier-protein]--UDP-N-acetylglucosamine O-acyltransferase [Porphyromonadaceae bacterium]|nr:acyl-[acyl-carrier-protein]--UDP-N-acetylglucosamine O-acyltransferase [Porphyromonadaceae bacterium]